MIIIIGSGRTPTLTEHLLCELGGTPERQTYGSSGD